MVLRLPCTFLPAVPLTDILLKTARLQLVPFTADDYPLLSRLHADPEVNRFLSPGRYPMAEDEVHERLEKYVADHLRTGFSKWKVLTLGGTFLGRAGVTYMADLQVYELGYTLMQSAWGKGYATEIARGLVPWFFDKTDETCLIAYAYSDNTASRHVMEKAGFQHWYDAERHGVACSFYRIFRKEAEG